MAISECSVTIITGHFFFSVKSSTNVKPAEVINYFVILPRYDN